MKYQVEEREDRISPLLGFWEIETEEILNKEQLENLKRNFKVFAVEHNLHEVQSYVYQKYGDMGDGWKKYIVEELEDFFEKPFTITKVN